MKASDRFTGPVFFDEVRPEADPFAGMVLGASGRYSNEIVARVVELVRTLFPEVQARTLVIPPQSEIRDPERILVDLPTLMADRVGDGELFIVTAPGDDFWQAHNLAEIERNGSLELVGSTSQTILDTEQRLRGWLAPLRHKHSQYLKDLIQLPEGGVIIATRPSGDFGLIERLQNIAQGRLIVHDVAPASARLSRGKIDDSIPHLVLPTYVGYFGEMLNNCGLQAVAVAQNVFSKESFESIDEFIRSCRRGNVPRVVILQSLAPSDHANLFPAGQDLMSDAFQGHFTVNFVHFLEQSNMSPIDLETFGKMAMLHAMHTVVSELLELVTRELKAKASAHGYHHRRHYIVEEEVTVSKDEAEVIADAIVKDLGGAIYTGRANVLTTGPFGTRLSKDPNVSSSGVEIRSQQIVSILSNSVDKAPFDERDPRVSIISENNFITPGDFRFVDTCYLSALVSMPVLTQNDRNMVAWAKWLGAKIGHTYVFQVLTQDGRAPVISAVRDPSRFEEVFCGPHPGQ